MAETVKGMNIKLGLDTTELEANIKSLNANLREQKRDLTAINKNLRFDSGNLDLWKQKQDKLNQTITLTRQKLDDQNKQLHEAKKAVAIGAMSEAEFNKLRRSVQYTETDLANLNNQLKRTDDNIRKLSGINVAAIGKIGSSFTRHITVPATAAATALSVLVISTTNTVDELAASAKKLGVSIEALQEWHHAANSLGSSAETMDKAFIKVNSILGDIATGDASNVAESLALIGLTVDDLKGLNTEEAFEVIRKALAGIEDQATRTAVANAFFGEKIGTELTPVIVASGDEINGAREEARQYGIVTEENAAVALKFKESLNSLKLAMNSLNLALANMFIPSLENVVVTIRDKVIPNIKKLIEWWQGLSKNVRTTITVLVGMAVAIGPMLTKFSKLLTMVNTVKTAFTAVSGAVQIAGASVKFSTLGWAALIALLAVVLLQNEKFREVLGRVFDILMDLVNKVMDLVSSLVEALMPIIEAIIEVLNTLIDVIADLLNEVLDFIVDILDVIIDLIKSLIPIVKRIIDMIVQILIPIIELIMEILNPIIAIIKLLINLILEIVSVILQLIEAVLDPIIDIIMVVADILNLVINIIVKLLDIIIDILNPILKIIIALIEPIIELVGIVIEILAILIELLTPLLHLLLAPIVDLLEFLFVIIEAIAPILIVLANIIKAVVVPVLELLFAILEPILEILTAIIEAVKWLLEKAAGIFGWVIDLFTGGSFSSNNAVKNSSTTNNTVDSSNTTNNVTINTSGDVDIDSINAALGGAY